MKLLAIVETTIKLGKKMINKPFTFIAAAVSILVAQCVSADQEKLKVSGFGTLASATADTRIYQFRNDRSQAEYAKKDGFAFKPLSLIGVQLDYSVSDDLDFVGQFVYR